MHQRQIITTFLLFSFQQQIVTGSLIVGGEKVADDAMLYMVSVQNRKGHVCGGFLVSENYVLTAAHCIDEEPVKVVLGSHNLKPSKKRKQIIRIEKKIEHDSYEKTSKSNDLMLLKLMTSAKCNKNVKIIQLPNKSTTVKVNEWCKVAGWGQKTKDGDSVSDLYYTNVSIIETGECKKEWSQLPDKVTCARGKSNGRTLNAADCGGPLVCKDLPVGIASFNRIFDKEGPMVFVDVVKYLDWINQKITVSQ